jgi:DNA-binding transcriptional LysR family regulator
MQYSLEQVEAFVLAADTGSFSQAARELGKAQSTISTLIGNLEIDVGAELFVRSGRTTELTTAGIELIAEARSVLLSYQLFTGRCQAIDQDVETSLIMALDASTLPRAYVANALRKFGERYPLVRLVLLETGYTGAYELVSTGEAQVGVMLSQDSYPTEINYRGIASSAFVSLVAASHPLADKQRITPRDLAMTRHLRITSRQVLMNRPDTEVSKNIWYVESYRALLDLVADGLGWADIPEHMAGEGLSNGTLARLKTDHQRVPYAHPVDLIWSKRARNGAASQWLIKVLSDGAPKEL